MLSALHPTHLLSCTALAHKACTISNANTTYQPLISPLERIVVKYDNGEVQTVNIGHAETEGDDLGPPAIGCSVCMKSRGGKYSAVVQDVEVCMCICTI